MVNQLRVIQPVPRPLLLLPSLPGPPVLKRRVGNQVSCASFAPRDEKSTESFSPRKN